MSAIPGRNTISAEQLQGYIDRIERIRSQKKQLGEDEKLVFQELKSNGFSTKRVREVLTIRTMKPGDLDEAQTMLDMYLHALGMQREAPLFRAVGQMGVDTAAREQVIEAFKQLVPQEGEIIVKIGSEPVRLFRDEDGVAHAIAHIERPLAATESKPSPLTPPATSVPDVDVAGAEAMGRQAFADNQPITSNPFPWDDERRPSFDKGWRDASGTDGMGPDD